MQQTVWLLTLIGMGFVALIFAYVFVTATAEGDGDKVKARWYGIRPWWFGLLIVLIIMALSMTLSRLPYAATHGKSTQTADIVVQATAHQWYWQIDRTELPVNQEVEFHVSSADVNHGFGLYDEHDQLLVQTQAMPGYTNIVHYRFDKAGTYRILCMEYCGLAHHAMIGTLNVSVIE